MTPKHKHAKRIAKEIRGGKRNWMGNWISEKRAPNWRAMAQKQRRETLARTSYQLWSISTEQSHRLRSFDGQQSDEWRWDGRFWVHRLSGNYPRTNAWIAAQSAPLK